MVDRSTGFLDALVMAKLPRDELRAALVVHQALVEVDGFDIGVLCSSRYLASMMGLRHKRRAETLLERLVARGVLLVTQPAAGNRATAYTLDEIHRWRGVTWGIESDAVRALRFDYASGRLAPVKPPFVAHPRAPQNDFATHARRPQNRPSGARRSATTSTLATHARAPQNSESITDDTILLNSRDSLPQKEGLDELAGLIGKRVGNRPIHARKLDELAEAMGDADPALLWSAVRKAPTDLTSINAHISLVRQTAAVAGMPDETKPPPPPPPDLPEHDPEAVGADVGKAQVRQMRESLRNRADVAPTCETAAVEVSGA